MAPGGLSGQGLENLILLIKSSRSKDTAAASDCALLPDEELAEIRVGGKFGSGD